MATGSRHSIAYTLESVRGQTPAMPTLQQLRNTGTTLNLSKEILTSDELRDDRMIAEVRHGNKQVGGDINFALSYGTYDDFLAAALCGTWSGDELVVGVARTHFSIERHFADIGKYLRYTGMEVNTLSLSVTPNAVVTGAFGFLGKGMEPGDAELSGATYEAPTTSRAFDSFTGEIKEDGATLGIVTEIQLSLNNGLEPEFVLFDNESTDPTIGRSNVTGSITAKFMNTVLLEKFLDETASSLEFTLVDLDGNALSFYLPSIVYTGGANPDVSGEGAVRLSLPFQAALDSTEGTNMIVTRADAV